jgi:hypothetical protein
LCKWTISRSEGFVSVEGFNWYVNEKFMNWRIWIRID